MIRITSKKDGFRRCGIEHPDKAKDYPNDFFSAEKLKALQAEPMLVVQELPDAEPEKSNAGPEKSKSKNKE